MTKKKGLDPEIRKEVVQILDNYGLVLEDEKSLGRSSISVVYKATNKVTRNIEACKIIFLSNSLTLKEKKEAVGSFTELMESLMQFNSYPGISPIKYYHINDRFALIGTEYYPFHSVETLISDRNGKLYDESVIKVMAHQILSTLLNLHNGGIVHGNLKPKNLLIDSRSKINISDISLKNLLCTLNKSSVKESSKRYSAPESAKSITEKSDVWSFGIIMQELAYGKKAFSLDQLRNMDPDNVLVEFNTRLGYSPEMAAFISKCVNRNPSSRPSVEDMLGDDWLNDGKEISNNRNIRNRNN